MRYSARGYLHKESGKYRLALRDFDRALDIDAKFADAYNNRADVYLSIKQPEEAVGDLDEAIRLDHKFAIAYVNRSFAWTMMGRDTEAEEDVETATAMGLDRDIIAAKIKELKTQR